jgi:hypothetical protein
LRKFGVPYWGLSHVFGKDPMYWYRIVTGLGRNSVVGTTVRSAGALPDDLLADEKHLKLGGEKVYVATTVAKECCLGAEVACGAGTDELTEAYRVFHDEAKDIDPGYTPKTVNTDGWSATQSAWKTLFPRIAVIQCFLHAFLKIRNRAKHLGDLFWTIGEKVWGAYHAPNRRSFSQRIRSLKHWAANTLTAGPAKDKVLDLCKKRNRWSVAYNYPTAHRTSNMLDRLMRFMDRYFFDGQHLHGSHEASNLGCRAWALLWNFAPSHPRVVAAHEGRQSPAERLNRQKYHDCWLQNLLVSASMGGYRTAPQKPRY